MLSYLERCVSTVSQINIGELEQLTVGPAIGHGGAFTTHHLGTLLIAGESLSTAVKIAVTDSRRGGPIMRMAKEISLINGMLEKVPELESEVPAFLGVIAIRGRTDEAAVITEDATRGTPYSIQSTPLHATTRQLLETAFRPIAGDDEPILNVETVNRSLAFTVDGRQRLLDFTPSPFGNRVTYDIYDNHPIHNIVLDWLDSLTVTIAAGSPLAESLYYPSN